MRLAKIRESFKGKADALLITSDVNRFYASGMKSSDGYMLITADSADLFLDFRYFEAATKKQSSGEIDAGITIHLAEKSRKENLEDIFSAHDVKKLLCENKRLTVFEFDGIKNSLPCVEVEGDDGIVDKVRSVKDADEIDLIRKAQTITDMAFEHILGFITPEKTEIEIALELEFFMRKHGSQGVAFDTICVSGQNSSLPHGVPGDKRIGNGFVTMDFGARYKGYCSDMTRTVCVGKPTEKMRHVYDTVLEAQRCAFEKIHSGVVGRQVDEAARNIIYDAGYKGCFGHSTGHSLGIEIHEAPNFSPRCETEIPEGAVLSVEPGIYLNAEFGVRIEDIVVVTQKGYENLTKSTKDFIIL